MAFSEKPSDAATDQQELEQGVTNAVANQQFWASPVGRARAARQKGLALFEISLPVLSNEGSAVRQGHSTTSSSGYDNSEALSAITAEGWQLHTVSTTFVTTGSVISDKWSGMGRSEGVSGYVLATYVFTRLGQDVV